MSARIAGLAGALALAGCATTLPAGSAAEAPRQAYAARCKPWDEWDSPAPPARIHGDIYQVGTCGITALLVATPEGHVLIDGGVEAAAPLVAANVTALGFRLEDIRYILVSHEHYDHVAAIAALQRLTGATLVARAAARAGLETGRVAPADPQAELHPPFPPARIGRVIADGDTVRLGGIAFTAHATPGHTPGSTSWTWRSCAAGQCLTAAYVDSLSAVSAEGYRFADHPELIAAFRSTFAKVATLPCDLLMTPHPSASGFVERMAGAAPLIDAQGCVRYAAAARTALDARLAKEGAGAR
jgi:metallo-beta-lactamase class B